MKNKVSVTICGQEFNITAEETEEYIMMIASQVDRRMNEILSQNTKVSVSAAAVLTAVNICDEMIKIQRSSDNLRLQIKQYLDDAAKARQEADEARREIMRIRNEVQDLKIQIVKKDAEINRYR